MKAIVRSIMFTVPLWALAVQAGPINGWGQISLREGYFPNGNEVQEVLSLTERVLSEASWLVGEAQTESNRINDTTNDFTYWRRQNAINMIRSLEADAAAVLNAFRSWGVKDPSLMPSDFAILDHAFGRAEEAIRVFNSYAIEDRFSNTLRPLQERLKSYFNGNRETWSRLVAKTDELARQTSSLYGYSWSQWDRYGDLRYSIGKMRDRAREVNRKIAAEEYATAALREYLDSSIREMWEAFEKANSTVRSIADRSFADFYNRTATYLAHIDILFQRAYSDRGGVYPRIPIVLFGE